MNKTTIILALGAAALFGTAASAAPLANGLAFAPDNGIEQVRLICDDRGRCVRERPRRIIVEESYGRRGYDRGYRDRGYDRGPGVGIGVGPGGVSVGVGSGRY
jgi:hypothetical protein